PSCWSDSEPPTAPGRSAPSCWSDSEPPTAPGRSAPSCGGRRSFHRVWRRVKQTRPWSSAFSSGSCRARIEAMPQDTRHKSRILLDGRDRAPARSYLKAIGFTDADLAKPIVGIANTWTETMPCNYGLRGLAEHVKQGVR